MVREACGVLGSVHSGDEVYLRKSDACVSEKCLLMKHTHSTLPLAQSCRIDSHRNNPQPSYTPATPPKGPTCVRGLYNRVLGFYRAIRFSHSVPASIPSGIPESGKLSGKKKRKPYLIHQPDVSSRKDGS